MNLNEWRGAGRLGGDPELRYTGSGKAVMDINIACTRVWFNKETNQKNEETTWVSTTWWGKDAEQIAKFFGKGGEIYVEGRLVIEEWEDKQTQQKRSRMKVIGNRWQFCGDSKGGNREGDQTQRNENHDQTQHGDRRGGQEPQKERRTEPNQSPQQTKDWLNEGQGDDDIPF